jgi:hypothetical protein
MQLQVQVHRFSLVCTVCSMPWAVIPCMRMCGALAGLRAWGLSCDLMFLCCLQRAPTEEAAAVATATGVARMAKTAHLQRLLTPVRMMMHLAGLMGPRGRGISQQAAARSAPPSLASWPKWPTRRCKPCGKMMT